MSKPNFNDIAILELSYLNDLRMLDDDPAKSIVDEIISTFFEIVPGLLTQMQKAADTADLKALKSLAHSLKSSSGNLGAARLSAMCAFLEKNSNLDDVEANLQSLNAEYAKVSTELVAQMRKK